MSCGGGSSALRYWVIDKSELVMWALFQFIDDFVLPPLSPDNVAFLNILSI